MSRRWFLKAAASATLAAAMPVRAAVPVRAIAFDLFTLFDPRDVDRRATALLGPDGAAFAATWKTRLFEYCWIRAASDQYVRFDRLVRDALVHAGAAHGMVLSGSVRSELEAVFTELTPWPDTAGVLRELQARGLVLAPLANYAPSMIEALLDRAEIRERFEHVISTDRARTYKPHPRAYALGESVLGLSRREIAFAAFGGWDAAGARWYGYPTFWVNRLGVAAEQLETPDATGSDLSALAGWVTRR
jgi:2-haloacid dehalogenase